MRGRLNFLRSSSTNWMGGVHGNILSCKQACYRAWRHSYCQSVSPHFNYRIRKYDTCLFSITSTSPSFHSSKIKYILMEQHKMHLAQNESNWHKRVPYFSCLFPFIAALYIVNYYVLVPLDLEFLPLIIVFFCSSRKPICPVINVRNVLGLHLSERS